jgi:hypothetical protein
MEINLKFLTRLIAVLCGVGIMIVSIRRLTAGVGGVQSMIDSVYYM